MEDSQLTQLRSPIDQRRISKEICRRCRRRRRYEILFRQRYFPTFLSLPFSGGSVHFGHCSIGRISAIGGREKVGVCGTRKSLRMKFNLFGIDFPLESGAVFQVWLIGDCRVMARQLWLKYAGVEILSQHSFNVVNSRGCRGGSIYSGPVCLSLSQEYSSRFTIALAG